MEADRGYMLLQDRPSSVDDKAKENCVHECPTCKKTFTTAQFLRKHVKLHTGKAVKVSWDNPSLFYHPY